MRLTLIPALLAIPALAACSDGKPQAPAGTEIAANGAAVVPPPRPSPAVLPSATGAGTAFGLTTHQLKDAALVDGASTKLGEVERVETDATGNVASVLVEVADASPERIVRLPISDLSAIAGEKNWNLRTRSTREQLLALPAVAK